MANGIFLSAQDLESMSKKAKMYIDSLAAASNTANGLKQGDANFIIPGAGDKVVTQYGIRSEVQLTATNTSYQLGLLSGKMSTGAQTLNPGETRIQQPDLHIVYAMQYYLRIANTGSSTNYQNMLLFGPDAIFSQMGGVMNIYQQYGFWNGRASLNYNGRNLFEDWSLYNHMETPTTQSPIYQVGSATALYNLSNEKYGSTSGLYPMFPMVPLDGVTNVTFSLQFDSNFSAIFSSATPTIYAGVILRSLRAYNMGKVINPNVPLPH